MPDTISVIIATNRGGPYLRETVSSVRAQTSPVDEIILVDDGAPVGELDRLATALGLRHLHSPRGGVSAARNVGAAAAAGEWLVFLDDDDVWHPERIQCQREALASNPAAIASHTGGWFMDADGARFGVDWSARPAAALEMIRGAVPLPRITTLILRRDAFFGIGGFDEGMRVGEDNDLIRRLLICGESVAVDRSLVGYRRHPGNVSNRLLDGRLSARRSLRRLREQAVEAGDQAVVAAVEERMRRLRREGADEHLAELIAAVRRGDGRYAARLVWRALIAPRQIAGAAIRRSRMRRVTPGGQAPRVGRSPGSAP